MDKATFPAKLESLDAAMAFIRDHARQQGFDAANVNQVELASEEILVNVFNYAYPDTEGEVEVVCSIPDKGGLKVVISDHGIAFNPLDKKDPALDLPVEERPIGGLGIYIVRETMDEVSYVRENGRNVLTFIKY